MVNKYNSLMEYLDRNGTNKNLLRDAEYSMRTYGREDDKERYLKMKRQGEMAFRAYLTGNYPKAKSYEDDMVITYLFGVQDRKPAKPKQKRTPHKKELGTDFITGKYYRYVDNYTGHVGRLKLQRRTPRTVTFKWGDGREFHVSTRHVNGIEIATVVLGYGFTGRKVEVTLHANDITDKNGN